VDTITTDDDCHLWATSTGDGPPLILCHGGPGLWDMFGDVAAMLSDRLRVIRWDQRGCGRSERRGPYSMARTVADLDAVRQHFGLDQVALLGHSWGAQLALRYALDHPDFVSQLVYVSGVGLGWDWHADYQRNLDARVDPAALKSVQGRELAVLQWSADFADSTRARGYAEQMATPWFDINYECNDTLNTEARELWQESALVPACQSLPVPTLIVDGAQDIRPRWAVDSLAQALPRASRVVLPDVGHVPWLEDPDGFRSVLLAYLCVQS
jgi:proline iminopeptidase